MSHRAFGIAFVGLGSYLLASAQNEIFVTTSKRATATENGTSKIYSSEINLKPVVAFASIVHGVRLFLK